MSAIGGYGSPLNTRIEDLAEAADWAARRHGHGSVQAEEALQRYLCALESITAQRTDEDGAHSFDPYQPKPTRKSVAVILAARNGNRKRAITSRRKAA
ncbi:hypothetical protein [Nocardia sp. NPDC049707]|uniref:hypothetical protein n=1 Tax=Nocardia sp. NPDC049707 TaxID=3154735 RepID=UPI003437839B